MAWRQTSFQLARVLLGALVLQGCSSGLPGPAVAVHPGRAFVEVPYPPPAALVEVVPDAPAGDAVWVDGYWSWRGNKYAWLRGGWMLPPAGARYALWHLRYRADGTLFFAQGAWYDAHSNRVRDPETLLPARTPSNEVTPEDQRTH